MAHLKTAACVLLSLLFLGAGVLHLALPAGFVAIVPRQLPFPLALVYISGVVEIVGGIGLLVPALRVRAAWLLVALLVAVFPANVNMAVNHIYLPGLPHNTALLWARLPLQGVLIAWAWWFTRPV